MKKKNQLQISLEEWAEKTVKAYHEIALEVNLAYYTQSDLSKITESPEVAIVGINPGGGEKDTYEGQRNNKNWSYLHKNTQDKYHLLKGNYCKEGEEPSSWEKHKSWNYWSRLRHCLKKTYLKEFIDDDSKIIVTNASFFSTPTAKEIEEPLLDNTIPYTLELLEITNPKNLIFLSGKKCFERLSRLPSLKFKYKHICGNIYIGNLNDRLCIGIPHPAYKTNEELNLVASVMPLLIEQKNYKDTDVEFIKKECSEQIKAYEERIKNQLKAMCSIDINSVILCLKDKFNGVMTDPKKCVVKLNEALEVTITSKGGGYLGIRHYNFKGQCNYATLFYPNTLKYREILKKYQYDISQYAWIGQKSLKVYDGDNVEEVVNSIVKEVAKIKNDIDLI